MKYLLSGLIVTLLLSSFMFAVMNVVNAALRERLGKGKFGRQD